MKALRRLSRDRLARRRIVVGRAVPSAPGRDLPRGAARWITICESLRKARRFLGRHRSADILVRSNSRIPNRIGTSESFTSVRHCCGQECPRSDLVPAPPAWGQRALPPGCLGHTPLRRLLREVTAESYYWLPALTSPSRILPPRRPELRLTWPPERGTASNSHSSDRSGGRT